MKIAKTRKKLPSCSSYPVDIFRTIMGRCSAWTLYFPNHLLFKWSTQHGHTSFNALTPEQVLSTSCWRYRCFAFVLVLMKTINWHRSYLMDISESIWSDSYCPGDRRSVSSAIRNEHGIVPRGIDIPFWIIGSSFYVFFLTVWSFISRRLIFENQVPSSFGQNVCMCYHTEPELTDVS